MGAVEQQRRGEPVVARGGDESERAPVAVRHMAQAARGAVGTTAKPRHFRAEAGLPAPSGAALRAKGCAFWLSRSARFIKEDEPGDGPAWLPALPLLAGRRDVGAVLLRGAQRFFIAQAEVLETVPQGGEAEMHFEFARDALLEFGQCQIGLLMDPAAQRLAVLFQAGTPAAAALPGLDAAGGRLEFANNARRCAWRV